MTAAASGIGCATPEEKTPPAAHVADKGPWAEPPPGSADLVLPQSLRPKGTLEIFALGGLSPWETFYTIAEHGRSSSEQFYAFSGSGAFESWFESCGVNLNGPLYVPYATDSAGKTVNLGPFAYPLRDRPDMLERMRVWVVRHHLEPHEIAIPLAITGHSVGNPRMAALGSHLQRFFRERDSRLTLPSSYQLFMSSFDRTNNAPAFTASGLHASWARPLAVQLGGGARLAEQLARPGAGGRAAQQDELTRYYTSRLNEVLRGSNGELVRSGGAAEFSVSREAVGQAPELRALLPGELLAADPVTACVDPVVGQNPVLDETTRAFDLATHLLTNPTERARYVHLLDGGLITDRVGQGYDSHGAHVNQQATNVSHMLQNLSRVVARPGEDPTGKLNLDEHFVFINTEFGRAPTPEFSPRNPNGGGTNHWPWGYVVIGFGAFIDKERAGVQL